MPEGTHGVVDRTLVDSVMLPEMRVVVICVCVALSGVRASPSDPDRAKNCTISGVACGVGCGNYTDYSGVCVL